MIYRLAHPEFLEVNQLTAPGIRFRHQRQGPRQRSVSPVETAALPSPAPLIRVAAVIYAALIVIVVWFAPITASQLLGGGPRRTLGNVFYEEKTSTVGTMEL
jgi:hypothetical protein